MNDKMFEDELLKELSPGESEAIDRIMMSAAQEADAEVDYEGMLRRIKKAAAEEGIAVFPGAKERRRRAEKAGRERSGRSRIVSSLLMGAGAAAAVFAVGFAVLSMLGRFAPKAASPSANIDAPDKREVTNAPIEAAEKTESGLSLRSEPNAEATVCSLAPTAAPEPTAAPTQEAVVTKMPDITSSPDYSAVVPTIYPTKGGTAGIADLNSFVTDPAILEQLIPLLPEYMPAKTSPEESAVYAQGFDPESAVTRGYTCRIIDCSDEELPIGFARFSDNGEGLIRYVWRVTELTCLDIELSGFDLTEAEELLATMPLLENEAAAESRDAA